MLARAHALATLELHLPMCMCVCVCVCVCRCVLCVCSMSTPAFVYIFVMLERGARARSYYSISQSTSVFLLQESAQRRRFLVLFGVISSVWFLALPIAYYSVQVSLPPSLPLSRARALSLSRSLTLSHPLSPLPFLCQAVFLSLSLPLSLPPVAMPARAPACPCLWPAYVLYSLLHSCTSCSHLSY